MNEPHTPLKRLLEAPKQVQPVALFPKSAPPPTGQEERDRIHQRTIDNSTRDHFTSLGRLGLFGWLFGVARWLRFILATLKSVEQAVVELKSDRQASLMLGAKMDKIDQLEKAATAQDAHHSQRINDMSLRLDKMRDTLLAVAEVDVTAVLSRLVSGQAQAVEVVERLKAVSALVSTTLKDEAELRGESPPAAKEAQPLKKPRSRLTTTTPAGQVGPDGLMVVTRHQLVAKEGETSTMPASEVGLENLNVPLGNVEKARKIIFIDGSFQKVLKDSEA